MTGGVALRWIVLLGSSATTALVALARVMPRAYMTGPTSASFAGEIFSADFFLPFEFSFRACLGELHAAPDSKNQLRSKNVSQTQPAPAAPPWICSKTTVEQAPTPWFSWNT
jgi:hypothetical protein